MNAIYSVATFILLLAIVTGCSTTTEPFPTDNLLLNESFESGGEPSLGEWTSDFYEFANEAPSGGGNWSLQLEPGWLPEEGAAVRILAASPGEHVYRLTAMVKSTNSWPGSIRMGRDGDNDWEFAREVSTDSTWRQLSVTDTLTLGADDRIRIKLSAGSTEVASGRVLFDQVRLEKLQ